MIFLFQILCAVILCFLINFLGGKSRIFGYVNMSDLIRGGNFGFNLIFRILSPAIFISILSIILYKIERASFINNIWMIALWYIIINTLILLLLNRWVFIKKFLYILIQGSALFVSYIFYEFSLKRGTEFILPESGGFRTEIWFIIILYFYNLLTEYKENRDSGYGDEREKQDNLYQRVIKKKFNRFRKKYGHLLSPEFLENQILNNIFFSIMIYEDINRPKLVRWTEKVLFKFNLAKSTGIMQVQSKRFLSNEESIKEAQKIIFKIYSDYMEKTDEPENMYLYDLVDEISLAYNGSRYLRNIISIFEVVEYNSKSKI